MPGRTSTTWNRAWTTTETKVIRVPAGLAAQLLTIARHLDQGGEVQVVPLPDLFTPAPTKKKAPRKSRKPRK